MENDRCKSHKRVGVENVQAMHRTNWVSDSKASAEGRKKVRPRIAKLEGRFELTKHTEEQRLKGPRKCFITKCMKRLRTCLEKGQPDEKKRERPFREKS